MQNAVIIDNALFWNGNNYGLQSAKLWSTKRFYEQKGEGDAETREPKHEDWASIKLLTLSDLTFLFTLPRCQVIFQWKQAKEKLGNTLSASRSFRVFDLVNGK